MISKAFINPVVITMLCITILLAAFGASMTVWYVGSKPEPTIVVPIQGQYNYPSGLSKFLEAASVYDPDYDLEYVVHVSGPDKRPMVEALQLVAPVIGWYIASSTLSTYRMVLPERDLPIITSLADDPVRWFEENQQQLFINKGPASSKDLVSVKLHVDPYYGHTQAFLALSIVAYVFTAIMFLLSVLTVISETDEINKKREKEQKNTKVGWDGRPA